MHVLCNVRLKMFLCITRWIIQNYLPIRLNVHGVCFMDVKAILKLCGGRGTGVGLSLKALLSQIRDRPLLNSGRLVSWDKAYLKIRKRTGGVSAAGWYDVIEIKWNT